MHDKDDFERARAHAIEHHSSTMVNTETWGFGLALGAPHWVFIPWEPPPLRFITVSFDGSVRDRHGGAAFIICASGSGFLAAGGCHFLDPTISMVEL